MKQTDHISGHIFIEKYSRKLADFAAYAYESYLKSGKGVVIVDEVRDDGCKYYYSTTDQTEDYIVNLEDYDADNQIYFVWKRRDYPDECFVFADTDRGGPKWIHEWRQRYRIRPL